MSFTRRTPLWGSLALAFVCIAGAAQADELDQCRRQVSDSSNSTGSASALAKPVTLGLPAARREAERVRTDRDELVPLGDLRLAADFHPETDRWTERHNRIRITQWTAVWLFSGELDIHNDIAIGLRLAWEVPGFIGIRLDSGFVPWSRLEVKAPAGFAANPRSSRYVDGVVHSHTLSLGIFNPELSIEGLAFWAGFGGGLWIYSYSESDVFGIDSNIDGDFSDINISGNIFVELDYKIADIFHVGFGIRTHFILADHTDEGRFYDLNDVNQSIDTGRNDGPLDDLAVVTEFTLNISILF